MLQIKGLVKKYDKLIAVDGVDLLIPEGICFGLLGPNGAGKSTTIEVIEGIKKPTSGEILYNDNPVDKTFKEIIGIQFQFLNELATQRPPLIFVFLQDASLSQ